jgi:TP901 family phage tail tape measure protein
MAEPIARLAVVVGSDITGALSGLGRLDASIGSLVGGIGKLGVAAVVGIGGAVAAGTAVAVKGAGDLEEAVASISTIRPDVDTATVFRALNEMSTRIPQTAGQLADSLYNIFSSIDIDQAGALQLTEVFAKGATAARTDAETFGTAILGVLNAYKLGVEDADHVSDVFFNTVNKGVVTGAELAASLGIVTGSAKAAGVNFDTLGGLIAGVTKEGGPAAQNINNLSNFLAKLNSEKAVKGFQELGVQTVDAQGNFRNITDILKDARAALNKLAPAARNAAIGEIFPDFQARAGFNTLLSQLDFVNEVIADNKTVTGTTASAFEKMSNTFNAQAKLLGNALHAIFVEIGSELLPVITPLVQAFRMELPRVFETARAVIATFTTHVGALGIVLANIRHWFGDAVADGIEPFFQAFMTGGWGELAGLIGQRLLQGIQTAWTALTTWIGQAWASIDWDALFASLGPLGGVLAEIGRIAQTVWPQMQAFAGWLGEVWTQVVALGVLEDLKTGITNVWNALGPALELLNPFRDGLGGTDEKANNLSVSAEGVALSIKSMSKSFADTTAQIAPFLQMIRDIETTLNNILAIAEGRPFGSIGGRIQGTEAPPPAATTLNTASDAAAAALNNTAADIAARLGLGGGPQVTFNIGQVNDRADADHIIDQVIGIFSGAARRVPAVAP